MGNWFANLLGPTVAKSIDSLKDDVVGAVRSEITKYAPQLLQMGKEQFDKYFPELLELAKDQLEKYGPQLMEIARKELGEQFDRWLPIIVTAISQTVMETSSRLITGGVDKITDAIPGQLDDQLLDGIPGKVLGTIQEVFSERFAAQFPAQQPPHDGRS